MNELKNKNKKFAEETLFFFCNTVIKTVRKKFAIKKRRKGRNKTTILTYQCALLQFKKRYMLMYMSVWY